MHHSHTQCQAPRANATTKACQRVCLPQHTADEKELSLKFSFKQVVFQRCSKRNALIETCEILIGCFIGSVNRFFIGVQDIGDFKPDLKPFVFPRSLLALKFRLLNGLV